MKVAPLEREKTARPLLSEKTKQMLVALLVTALIASLIAVLIVCPHALFSGVGHFCLPIHSEAGTAIVAVALGLYLVYRYRHELKEIINRVFHFAQSVVHHRVAHLTKKKTETDDIHRPSSLRMEALRLTNLRAAEGFSSPS